MFLLNLVRNWLEDVRRNHGLEHATVAVLFARRGPQRLAGRASGNGFFILGKVDADLLESCAQEALSRIKRGESGLVVSPMCGTNLVVTGGVCALATMVSLTLSREKKPQERLGDAVSEAVWDQGFHVERLAVREIPRSGEPDELLDRYGISATAIVAAVKRTR